MSLTTMGDVLHNVRQKGKLKYLLSKENFKEHNRY